MSIFLFESFFLIPFLFLAFYSLVQKKPTQNNDTADGIYEEFYDNGQIKGRQSVKNGKLNGVHEEFFDNGQIKFRANYKDNEKIGFNKMHYALMIVVLLCLHDYSVV